MALATNQITYLQLIDMFDQFAADHYQINNSGNGAMSELVESQEAGQWDYKNYPIFWVIDDTPVVEFDDGQLLHNFQIVVADIDFDKKIKKNTEAQIKSNMMYIYQDFLAYLKVEPKISKEIGFILSQYLPVCLSWAQRWKRGTIVMRVAG